jgi:HK97 family phage major capsid protein
MNKRLAKLLARLDGAIKSYREHLDTEAPTEAAALEAYDKKTGELKAAMDAASAAVASERAALEAERQMEGVPLQTREGAIIAPGAENADPRGGFKSLGEFTVAVHRAGRPGGQIDPRLNKEAAAPTTFGNEATGADGGYAVPPEFGREIYAHSLAEGSFLPLCDELPLSGNSMTFPTDETTPWGTTGIRAFWQGEGTSAQERKPVLGERTLKLKKLIGLVPMSDELLADGVAGGAYVRKKFGEVLAWKCNSAIVTGNGNGIPLGYRATAAAITQTKESGQAADTIVTANVSKMLSRLLPVSLASPSTRWLMNNDCLSQIVGLTIGNQPVWTPPNAGIKDAPLGFLLGRPIVPTQVCATLGDLGDIELVDFRQYQVITKGPEIAESMHLYFDAGATAFRLTFRMDGAPWMKDPVTPANGSNSLAPFVRLEARA